MAWKHKKKVCKFRLPHKENRMSNLHKNIVHENLKKKEQLQSLKNQSL